MGLLFIHINCSSTNPVTSFFNSLSSKTKSSSLAQKVGKFLPSSSKEFIDIYALESQVRNHRAWVQERSKELKSTKKALRSLMNASRQNDFQLYEFIDANLSVMAAAHENVLSNAKKEKKLIIRVQKSKKTNIDTKIPGKDNTYLQQFIILDDAIDLRKSAYQESISKIKKALVKRDMDLVFIKEQKNEWFFITEELSDKRKEFQPSIDKLTASLVDAITNETNHIEKISKQLNKVESINKRLDFLDKLFLNIDKIAEKQKGGRVYLKKSSEFKEEYEIRFEKSVKDYEKYLENLRQLFIN
ncbi:MAG: hypothetical protein VX260_01640 [Candidatus Neomarinimicrobiota bacterium]|nr:hypothetical protein [Candidatus Neomarinimicrobiota bacterium]MEE3195642.1 hypothetical protein [Candidatus Neomarinimicrobiota bacterium]